MALEQFKLYYISSLLGSNFVMLGLILWFFLFFLWINFSFLRKKLSNLLIQILVLIRQQSSNYHIYIYIPLLFTLLFIILNANYNGLVLYGFTISSHIFFTITYALSCFLGITLIGLLNNHFNFRYFFIPHGVENKFLLFFVVFIEILSYLIRPLSLSIRLFANMLAGHTLLFIIGNSVLVVKNFGIWLLNIIPLLIIFFILCLELAIAGIQTYVFIILLLIYLIDMYLIVNHLN